MRHLLIVAILLLAAPAHAAVELVEQHDFIKIKELDGAETLQLLYLRKRDVSAVTYSKTGFNQGELTIIMHYTDSDGDGGGTPIIYRIGMPPNQQGEAMADRIIRMIEPDAGDGGRVIKREYGFPKPD